MCVFNALIFWEIVILAELMRTTVLKKVFIIQFGITLVGKIVSYVDHPITFFAGVGTTLKATPFALSKELSSSLK